MGGRLPSESALRHDDASVVPRRGRDVGYPVDVVLRHMEDLDGRPRGRGSVYVQESPPHHGAVDGLDDAERAKGRVKFLQKAR